jgi:hypothetical protein
MANISVVNPESLVSSLGVYCPRCGVQASQSDSRFCRACGVDLTLVSEAMAGQIAWRTHLRTRLDNFFLSKREFEDRENAREGAWNLIIGCTLLPIGIWSLVSRDAPPVIWGIILSISFVSLKIGIGNMRLYKRYLQGNSRPEIRPDNGDLIVLKIDDKHRERHMPAPPQDAGGVPGVTERMTKFLEEDPHKTQ